MDRQEQTEGDNDQPMTQGGESIGDKDTTQNTDNKRSHRVEQDGRQAETSSDLVTRVRRETQYGQRDNDARTRKDTLQGGMSTRRKDPRGERRGRREGCLENTQGDNKTKRDKGLTKNSGSPVDGSSETSRSRTLYSQCYGLGLIQPCAVKHRIKDNCLTDRQTQTSNWTARI